MLRSIVPKLRSSRLFGAWFGSMIARTVSLVPLAFILVRPDMSSAPAIRSYILTFSILASSSYALNQLYEFEHFHRSDVRRTTGYARLLQSGTVAFAAVMLLSPLYSTDQYAVIGGVMAAFLQPAIAHRRTLLVNTSELYRIGYLSTGVRDALPAAIATAALISGGAPHYIGIALLMGCILQYVVLTFYCRRAAIPVSPVSISLSGHTRQVAPVLLAAVSLALFQPIAKSLAEQLPASDSLSLYELADRPAYTVALVAAGGVGTELQRRWSGMPVAQRRSELSKALKAFIVIMGATGIVATGLVIVLTRYWDEFNSTLLLLVPLAFTSNLLYLLSVGHTRLLFAEKRPGMAARAYIYGVAVMVLTWLFVRPHWSEVALIPIIVAFGFAVSVVVARLALRTDLESTT